MTSLRLQLRGAKGRSKCVPEYYAMILFAKNKFCIAVLLLTSVQVALGQIAQNAEAVSEGTVPAVAQKFADLDQRIHYGDLLEVDVVGSTEFDWRGGLTPEGFLSGVQFTNTPVFGLCRTGSQVAKEIEAAYSKFLKDPSVKVEILDKSNRPLATLFGAVVLPQRFKLEKDVNLRELIVLSGGFSENTGAEIEIFRQPSAACVGFGNEPLLEERPENVLREAELKSIAIKDILKGVPDSNPAIFYGDLITVKKADPVYVIGNVGNPGSLAISENLTVERAIDAAGGFLGEKADMSVRVFRRNGQSTTVLDFPDSNEGRDITTFSLQEYDIVEVFGKTKKKSKFPPVLRLDEKGKKKIDQLPVRIIK